MKSTTLTDWMFRFIKGMFMGTGAILPGVSGGALAAVFGIYEQMIAFMANMRKNFKANFLFFLPIGMGGLVSIFLVSFALSYFFEKTEVQLLWFFIGCIIGIFPSLIKEASKKGRELKHIFISIITAVVAFVFLLSVQDLVTTTLPLNFGTWVMAGAIFGLGLIVPGLSPSNFLVYLDMYEPMTAGIKELDLSILLPLGIGLLLVIVLLANLISLMFEKAYTELFHFILGVVLASTVMIVPTDYDYLSFGAISCLMVCILGISLGVWMSQLEETYKPPA